MNATALLDFLKPLVDDAGHGWSIGTFGASGEFIRTGDEATQRFDTDDAIAIATERGALKIAPAIDAHVVAYDNINKDGETWSHAAVVCAPFAEDAPQVVTPLGTDTEAVQAAHRGDQLYDLGVGLGLVRFCVRTTDAELIDVLNNQAGKPVLGPGGGEVNKAVLKAQPNRVLISPFARVEVYQDIPPPDGNSPEGPHTHLLPKLIAKRRTHSANTPLPEGTQSVLNLHPRSPWRDKLGRRIDFDPAADADFEALLRQYALPSDARVRREVETAVAAGVNPADFAWPTTRRGRIQARVTLRRLAATGDEHQVTAWRTAYDRLAVETDMIEEEDETA